MCQSEVKSRGPWDNLGKPPGRLSVYVLKPWPLMYEAMLKKPWRTPGLTSDYPPA